MKTSRRSFLKSAAAIGAALAWAGPAGCSLVRWRERRDLFPEASLRAIPMRTA